MKTQTQNKPVSLFYFSLSNQLDNNNCSNTYRTLSQRILAAIVVGRMFQDNEILARDKDILGNFCEQGELCCLYDERQDTNHIRVTSNMTNLDIINLLSHAANPYRDNP